MTRKRIGLCVGATLYALGVSSAMAAPLPGEPATAVVPTVAANVAAGDVSATDLAVSEEAIVLAQLTPQQRAQVARQRARNAANQRRRANIAAANRRRALDVQAAQRRRAADVRAARRRAALDRRARRGRIYRHGRYYYPRHDGRYYDRTGGLLAGVVIGGAAAAIASQAYGGYDPYAGRSRTVIVDGGLPAPYSAEWYRRCDRKYRSFRASDGTYLGYDGVRHTCRLP